MQGFRPAKQAIWQLSLSDFVTLDVLAMLFGPENSGHKQNTKVEFPKMRLSRRFQEALPR